jgi:hypothetical protein
LSQGSPRRLHVSSGPSYYGYADGFTVKSGGVLYLDQNAHVSGLTVESGGTVEGPGAPPCFLAGVRIMTGSGGVPVERLREGDLVVTHMGPGPLAPVGWIGHRTVDASTHPRPEDIWPIRIRRGAVAPGQPDSDLLVSPDHCIHLDGVLIPAKLLVNGMTVIQDSGFRRLEYFHVELEQRAVLVSDGLPTESYLDTGNRAGFANSGVPPLLHPSFPTSRGGQPRLRTFAVAAAAVGPVWRRLASIAVAAGFTPHGLRRQPATRISGCWRPGGSSVRPPAVAWADGSLRCRQERRKRCSVHGPARPSETGPFDEDHRLLGVAVCRLRLSGNGWLNETAIDTPCPGPWMVVRRARRECHMALDRRRSAHPVAARHRCARG